MPVESLDEPDRKQIRVAKLYPQLDRLQQRGIVSMRPSVFDWRLRKLRLVQLERRVLELSDEQPIKKQRLPAIRVDYCGKSAAGR